MSPVGERNFRYSNVRSHRVPHSYFSVRVGPRYLRYELARPGRRKQWTRCTKTHEGKQISWKIIYYVYMYRITRPSRDPRVCYKNTLTWWHHSDFASKSNAIYTHRFSKRRRNNISMHRHTRARVDNGSIQMERCRDVLPIRSNNLTSIKLALSNIKNRYAIVKLIIRC